MINRQRDRLFRSCLGLAQDQLQRFARADIGQQGLVGRDPVLAALGQREAGDLAGLYVEAQHLQKAPDAKQIAFALAPFSRPNILEIEMAAVL